MFLHKQGREKNSIYEKLVDKMKENKDAISKMVKSRMNYWLFKYLRYTITKYKTSRNVPLLILKQLNNQPDSFWVFARIHVNLFIHLLFFCYYSIQKSFLTSSLKNSISTKHCSCSHWQQIIFGEHLHPLAAVTRQGMLVFQEWVWLIRPTMLCPLLVARQAGRDHVWPP